MNADTDVIVACPMAYITKLKFLLLKFELLSPSKELMFSSALVS